MRPLAALAVLLLQGVACRSVWGIHDLSEGIDASNGGGDASPGEVGPPAPDSAFPEEPDAKGDATLDVLVEQGVCTPGALQCAVGSDGGSANATQLCDDGGQWSAPSDCVDTTCISGVCLGSCAPGQTECIGNAISTCSASGSWQSPSDCDGSICVADGGSASCQGVCSPGATTCASPTQIETCGSDGGWGAPSTCTYACVNGACGGACVPGSVQCNAQQPQQCSTSGIWQDNGAACSSSEPCTNGICVSVCQGGQSNPSVLASIDAGAPWGIAQDATNVYWTNQTSSGTGGSVMQVAKTGGTPISLASAESQPTGVTTDGTYVYWVDYGTGGDGGSVMTCAIGGCQGNPTTLCGNNLSGGPWGIAVDSDSVYWSEGVSIMKIALGSDVCPNGPLCNESNNPYAVAVDSANVYFTDSVGALQSCPIGGGSATAIASSPSSSASYGLAIDSMNLYWTNSAGGTVTQVPKSGGTAIMLASGESNPNGIASDGLCVYWTAGNAIRIAPVGGGPIGTFASGQAGPENIVVDSTSVYWTNSGGTIMKAAKP